MTELGNKLQAAIDTKNIDITLTSAVWKLQNGQEIKLIDCSEQDLNKYYKHCMDMLYNKNIYNPGKFIIRENLRKTYDNCNTELFIRHLLHNCNLETIKTKKDLLDFISQYRENVDVRNEDYISTLFEKLPVIYEKITVGKLLDGCFDKLDVVNKKMISDKFILSLGIWLTDEEKEDLSEYTEDGKLRSRMEVIKERLVLNQDIMLRIDTNGLSYNQFRAIMQMSTLPKISTLPTLTLEVLRDKILILLDNVLDYHINKWTALSQTIENVAKHKEITLK